MKNRRSFGLSLCVSGLASVIIPMAKAFGVRVITTVLTDEIARNIEHLHADRLPKPKPPTIFSIRARTLAKLC